MKDNFVLEVNYPYVLDDCVEVAIPYGESVTIIGEEGMIYHDSDTSIKNNNINKFLTDERRNNLPYANIPTYKSKFLFDEMNYTIQLLNYNSKYLIINPNSVVEYYPIKVDDKALIAVKQLDYSEEHIMYQSRRQVENIFKPTSKDEQSYAIFEDGTFSENIYLPTEKVIINQAKENLKKNLDMLIEDATTYLEKKYDKSTPLIGLEEYLKNINLDKIPLRDVKFLDENILCIKTRQGNIDAREVSIRFDGANTYRLQVYDINIIDYKLGQLKRDSNIIKAKDFRINPLFNKDIPKDEISKAKRLLKTLKKEKKG